MKFNLKYSLILCFACATFSLAAQDENLESGSVEIIRSFDARLLDSEKINLNPSLPAVDTSSKRQRYNIPIQSLDIKYPPPRIRPLALSGDRLPPSYKGYLKAGGGIPNSFYGEGAYRVFAQERLDVGLEVMHHSANNSANLENQRFALTQAKADGTFYSDQGFAMKGKIGYSSDNIFYYGYNAERDQNTVFDEVPKEEVKQTYSILDVGVELFNGTRTVGDFNYSAGIDVYTMGDISPTSESGFDLKIMGEKWFKEKFPFRLTLRTDFNRYSTTSDSIQRLNNFFLQPNFTYNTDFFKVKVGANLASSDDVFSLFPDIEVSANAIPGLVTIFAGAEGDLHKNNYRNLTDYNPFLQSAVNIRNTRYNRYYIGAKGNVQGISYQAEFNYKGTEDLALFLQPRSSLTNRELVLLSVGGTELYQFDVLYDDVDIVNFKIGAEADIQEFKVAATLSQNFFNMTAEERAWHLPAFEFNGSVQYTTLEDKLQVKGEIFVQNAVPYLTPDGDIDNLDALFDISLGAEYYFTDNFGGFLNIYNLANNQRERWFRYPIYGINFLAGLSVRF
ncbi:MAG: hypothetical protein AAF847_02140 [Bacteroidota bacterium]